jgi:hypothetical protein
MALGGSCSDSDLAAFEEWLGFQAVAATPRIQSDSGFDLRSAVA